MSYIYYCRGTDVSFKKKSELIQPLEKMSKVPSMRDYHTVTPNPIKVLPGSPHLGSSGVKTGEILPYNWFLD